jgi:hypothetical protein
MGLISNILGLGRNSRNIGKAVEGVAEVFRPNATKRMQQAHDRSMASLEQFGKEFAVVRSGRFDRIVDGLNRLPRPALALGTIGLFAFAMWRPDAFALRMQGLNLVPEPLWWLLGAIVSFYFGAREMHHFRVRDARPSPLLASNLTAPGARFSGASAEGTGTAAPQPVAAAGRGPAGDPARPDANAALEDWRNGGGAGD